MKNHVWRPLILVVCLVGFILIVRSFLVPKDFGSHEQGYMYGWHRKSNEQEWKNKPIKYQGREYCKDCHTDKYAAIMDSPHKIIQCENCHGPAIDHYSDKRPKLEINKMRKHCLRCHFPLPYPSSGRSKIKGVDPVAHNPGMPCVTCHNPHKPNLENLGGMK